MTWVLNDRERAWQARIVRCRRLSKFALSEEDLALRKRLLWISRVNSEIKRREKARRK